MLLTLSPSPASSISLSTTGLPTSPQNICASSILKTHHHHQNSSLYHRITKLFRDNSLHIPSTFALFCFLFSVIWYLLPLSGNCPKLPQGLVSCLLPKFGPAYEMCFSLGFQQANSILDPLQPLLCKMCLSPKGKMQNRNKSKFLMIETVTSFTLGGGEKLSLPRGFLLPGEVMKMSPTQSSCSL